jgi:hypothetical protein
MTDVTLDEINRKLDAMLPLLEGIPVLAKAVNPVCSRGRSPRTRGPSLDERHDHAHPETRRRAMTGAELARSRATLGKLWGLDRPLRAAELGRILRLQGRDPGRSILDWEAGKFPVSGPVALAIDLMIAGAKPPRSGSA